MNILIGDNESGKSTILEAIELISSGSVKKIETIGIQSLFNIDAVKEFNAGQRTFQNLPKMIVELYLKGDFDYTMNGKNNTEKRECDGIRMICEPDDELINEINDSLQTDADYFPFEYYVVRFSTFADVTYTGYKKKLRCAFIDSSDMSSEYTTNFYIKKLYYQCTENNETERAKHRSQYQRMKNNFCKNDLSHLNSRLPAQHNYSFGFKNGTFDFEQNLMLYENDISIVNKGTGKQVLIKTDFAIENAGDNVDVILIEEPENHLSLVNLRNLIKKLENTVNGQLFISTHNNMICTRLELRNAIIMHVDSEKIPIKLDNLSEDTAKYFIKTPPAGILEFALAKKVILVEGPSEYMLFEKFYYEKTGIYPENDNVLIIDIRGLSFKRYLEIAKILNNKVAVVTDNDGDYQKNCINKYVDYNKSNNIKIFYETNNEESTFEIVLYNCNKDLFDTIFENDAFNYMLKNKTETAYKLLERGDIINIPNYIDEAIEWIRS